VPAPRGTPRSRPGVAQGVATGVCKTRAGRQESSGERSEVGDDGSVYPKNWVISQGPGGQVFGVGGLLSWVRLGGGAGLKKWEVSEGQE
jgi:hypothetical protein